MPMTDDRGASIRPGDCVQVLYVDTGRGAQQWMHRGEVVGFARTRVRVHFTRDNRVHNIGPECLRIVELSALDASPNQS